MLLNVFSSQVDVASLITQKLLKVSMKHIEIISKARQKGIAECIISLFFVFTCEKANDKPLFSPAPVKNAEYLQQAALEEYGPDLHVALRSRRDELLYLRKLTEMLFPYILPPKATDCRCCDDKGTNITASVHLIVPQGERLTLYSA